MGAFIADVAVTGVPDERWGESLVAFVVRAPGAAVTEEDIVAHCADELGHYKKPKRVVFVDDLQAEVLGQGAQRAPGRTRGGIRYRKGRTMADFDAVVVGAGCAGSVAAYELASAGKSVLLIERGADAGAKNMTGGRIYTHSLEAVFPDFSKRRRWNARSPRSAYPSSPRTEHDDGVRLAPLGAPGERLVFRAARALRPLAGVKAEQAGAECIFGIAVDGLVWEGGHVAGVSAGGDEITAEVTILADGVNSLLDRSGQAGDQATAPSAGGGVKETISLPAQVISDRFRAADDEGTAWLFAGAATQGHAGGGFLYTNREMHLYRPGGHAVRPVHVAGAHLPDDGGLQGPSCRGAPSGGREAGRVFRPPHSRGRVQHGAHAVRRRLPGHGRRAMLCINLGYQVRGMDYAVASGSRAAEAALEALEAGDVSAAKLAG